MNDPHIHTTPQQSAVLAGDVFKLEYSLKHKEVTKFTTELGYFHDLQLLVIAANVEEAVKVLRLWHGYDGSVPEGIKATNLGRCVRERIP